MLSLPVSRLRHIVKGSSFFLLILMITSPPLAAYAAEALPVHSDANGPTGAIAYVRNATELRLIQPDGNKDHMIWTAPKVGDVQSTIRYPAWRPDAGEIAFASDMEQTVSLMQSDIFAVKPDGSGLRRISDPPLHSQLGAFPTATVAVHVTNINVGDSLFIIYVAGAAQAQSVTVPAGTSKTVTFDNVAVFAGKDQIPVAINGITRWYCTSCTQSLQARTTNNVSFSIQDSGYDNVGAFKPVWRNDGAEIDFDIGDACTAQAMPTNPDPGSEWGGALLGYSASPCFLDRGPTAALNDQVLYWDKLGAAPNGAFVKVQEGAKQENVVLDSGYFGNVYGMKWLPDGSGFLFSYTNGDCSCSNIYSYIFGAQQATQVTHFNDAYTAGLAISPDGQYVVFEHSTTDPNPTLNPDLKPDLWMMKVDGSDMIPFVKNGRDPAWSRQAPTAPPVLANKVFLPAVIER